MQAFEPHWLILVVAGVLLACSALLSLALAVQVRELKRKDQLLEAAIRGLRAELSQKSRPSTGVDERQLRIERQLDQLRSRQDDLELQAANARPYGQAMKLVEGGANVDELVASCGLSRGEAELVASLYRLEKAS